MFGCSSWFGRWNDGGLCAVLLCCRVMSVMVVVVVAVAVVLLFVCLLARVDVLSSKKHGTRSRARDASHRRQHCCASIEDRAYCGVKLHLAACCSWGGCWDDGRVGAVLPLRCCVLFVVAVVFVIVVVVVVFACAYVCLRVLVCSAILEARRSATRARCRPPAPQHSCSIIEDLACSDFNQHLSAFCSCVER